MKRQAVADGIRLSDDIEQTEENGNKRIKLLNNEINKDNIQVDHTKDKSMMDVTLSENSNGHSHEDQGPAMSNNASPTKHNVLSENSGNNSIQSANETESAYENLSKTNNNCNGSYDEAVVEVSTSDSGIVSELYYMPSLENSVKIFEENKVCDKKTDPPSLKHCDYDLHNNESTNSVQSEMFDAQNVRDNSENNTVERHKDNSSFEVSEKPIVELSCEFSEKYTGESSYEISEKYTDELSHETSTKVKADTDHEIMEKLSSQKEDNNLENEFSFESNIKKIIDVENLTLSHLKVTELLGHTEEILCVAADEDFILSSSADTTTKAWNMERQNIISTFSGHSNSVTSVLLLNPNQSKKIKKTMSLTKVSRIAITGSLDCNIKLWSVLEGKELASVYTFNGITCLGYLESECFVVVGTEGGKLELWNLSLKKAVVSERAHEDKVTDIKVIDNYIYSVSVDGAIKVWSYEDEELSPVYSRKRKEISSDKSGFRPAQWGTVAVFDNIMYLGDSSSSIKMLDWRAGRLSLFKNQVKRQGVCNSITTRENVLFSSCYDSATKTSSINVWKLPEMTYVCTLAGAFPKINNVAAVQKDNKLKIIAGGDKLFICEFDFSKPPSSEGEFFVCEDEMLGHEINENPVEIKKAQNNTSSSSRSGENHSDSNRWCNVM